jgi:acyl-coenzyme A synthetase/AMP-(fatty) acid ligase/ankyrin repeat protein
MKEKLNITNSSQLIQAFLLHVVQCPEKTAVVYRSNSMSYGDFNEKVNTLANQLFATHRSLFTSGKTPITIGIMSSNKLESLISMLALLKLGVAFIPLNAEDPATRLNYVIDKSEVSLVLSDKNYPEVSNNAEIVLIKELLRNGHNSNEPYTGATNDDLAYVLFTSGSTAKNPKGVMQSHKGLAGQIINYTRDLRISNSDNILNLASFTHDQAMVDCFAALLNGATLCLYHAKNLSVPDLHGFMQGNKVTIFSSIPSMFRIIFEDVTNPNTFSHLRIVTIGGEETKLQHVELFQKSCPKHSLLINGYGATEMSWVSSYTVTTQTDLSELSTIPLGRMTGGINVCLDEEDGIKELCISSEYLSPGYWRNEEATVAGFFEKEGTRYYRTGDIVEVDDNECYHFKGRKIWHEKIRGKRINVLEVENAMMVTGFFNDCVVMGFGDTEKRKLYAFYEASPRLEKTQKIALSLQGLKKELGAEMLPSDFFELTNIPKLPNGKVNRQELNQILAEILAVPAQLDTVIDEQTHVSLKSTVKNIWASVLNIYPNFAEDLQFDKLGGDSQSAIWLAAKLNKYFETHCPLQSVIHPIDFYSSFASFFASLEDKLINLELDNNSYIYQYPSFQEKTIHYSPGFISYNAEITSHQMISIDYEALVILTEHYNNKYNINLRVAESHEAWFKIISDEIANPHGPAQIGLLAQRFGKKDDHITPAVLHINRVTGELTMFVADSTPSRKNIEGFGRKDEFYTKVHEQFPQIKFGIDRAGRQVDSVSCWADSLLYLVECLQVDMPNKITIRHTKTNCGYDFSFRSPPEGYKSSMRPIDVLVNQNIPLETDPQQRTLAQFISDHSELCTFSERHLPSQMNTNLWRTTYQFKVIVEQYLKEYIDPYVVHFVLKYKSKTDKQCIKDLYIKDTFFTVGSNNLESLSKIFACALQVKPDEIANIVFDELHDSAKLETRSFLNQRTINCTVHTKRESAITLFNAVLTHDFDQVKFLLEQGADVNYPCEEPILFLAVKKSNGSNEIIKMLLTYGADANILCHGKITPLFIAAEQGNLEAVQLLMDYNADPAIPCLKNKISPIQIAYKNTHYAIVLFLLKREQRSLKEALGINGDLLERDLYNAVFHQNVAQVQFLLEQGTDVNYPFDVSILFLAVKKSTGNNEIIKMLLTYGADANILCLGKETPLFIAAEQGNLEAVQWLIGYKADPTTPCLSTKITPIQIAKYNNHHEVVQFLLEHKENALNETLEAGDEQLPIANEGWSFSPSNYIYNLFFKQWHEEKEVANKDNAPSTTL